MCRIKICLIALAAALLAGCGNSAEERSGTQNIDTPSVSEPVSVPESSDNGEISDIGDTTSETTNEPTSEVKEMTITVNGVGFTASFYDTKAAEEFKAMLPLTLDMSELNGNEKYFYLDSRLTSASENVGHINSGDIMLYGSNCVVLFYDSFSTPYSYTRIGKIDDPDGLKKAVGKGNVTVKFEG